MQNINDNRRKRPQKMEITDTDEWLIYRLYAIKDQTRTTMMKHKTIDDDDGDADASTTKIAGKGGDDTKIIGEEGKDATKIVGEGEDATKIIGEGDDAMKTVGQDSNAMKII
uniref:Uncharacterized protein n=1 Tax=Romanomermis culicivorax TaxID=13658 RepID=A0A915IVT6_ROMCU